MTKIMSWNIDKFGIDKITSLNLVPYQTWMALVVRYSDDNPALTAIQLVQYAVVRYPATLFPQGNLVLDYNNIIVAATTQARAAINAGQTGQAYAAAFVVYLGTLPVSASITSLIAYLNRFIAPGTPRSVLFFLNRIVQRFFVDFPGYSFSAPLVAMVSSASHGDTNTQILTAVRGTLLVSVDPIQRLNYIMKNMVATGSPLPDIIVVYEVISGSPVTRYDTIDGSGAAGTLGLLAELRTQNVNYCLIPPVRMGGGNDIEGTAIYYNSATLNFTGPHIWTGNVAAAPGAGVLGNYNNSWNGVLPNTNVNVPGIVAPVPTNQLAGKCQFTAAGGAALQFTAANDRPPLLVTFTEVGGANRVIKLCTMHATQARAVAGVNEISNIPEMTAIGVNEVGVVMGDFNVNILNAADKGNAYNGLLAVAGGNYSLVFDDALALTYPFVGGGGAVANRSYLATMLGANLIQAGGVRPYTSNIPGLDPSSVDNILISGGGAFTNAMILNRLLGVSTANAVNSAALPALGTATYGYSNPAILAAPPASIPLGTNLAAGESPYGYILTNTIDATRAGATAARVALNQEYITAIHGTSDHLAIVVTI